MAYAPGHQNADRYFPNVMQVGELRKLFDAYWDADPTDRDSLLEEVAASDPVLADRLRGLIVAEAETSPANVALPMDLAPGRAFGAFRITEALGSGGMGQVFLASQEHPVRREVALKVMPWHVGLDPEQRARFTAERQALASLSHPNVASFYAAGETDDGLAYFAMEHVAGKPIDRYANEEGLNLTDRLRLVLQVCSGVSHAHRRGLIHRDLKPSNVLVTSHEDRPLVKIIDFGIAKAAAAGLRPQTFETNAGRIVGTVNYMSPEQARGEPGADTRVDVYALGVLLYRLLTGRTPFDFRPGEVPISRIFQRLDSEDPKPPSALAADTQTAALRGDLDWICLKAVARDPKRRYGSAADLARDVEAFLEDRAVDARPPTLSYRASKFVSRHRAGVAAVTSVLLAAILTTMWSLHQARRVETEAATANEVIGLLRDAFSAADPNQRDQALTVFDVVDQAAANLDNLDPANPTRARLAMELADIYRNLGKPEQSLTLWESAYTLEVSLNGDRSEAARRALAGKAIALRDNSRFEESEAALKEVLALAEATDGADSREALRARGNLAAHYLAQFRPDLARPLFEESYAQARDVYGPGDRDTLKIAANLALSLRTTDPARGIDLLERALTGLSAGPESDRIMLIGLEYNLLGMYGDTERSEEAASRITGLYQRSEALLGAAHPLTQSIREMEGTIAYGSGDLDRAIAILQTAYAQRREQSGPLHLQTIRLEANLLMVRVDRGDDPPALLAATEDLLARAKQVLESDSRILVQIWALVAEANLNAGRIERARTLITADVLPDEERARLLQHEAFTGAAGTAPGD
ncbi:MAG: serine/threonine-protein kinase [Pseudomonadota bacterium]